MLRRFLARLGFNYQDSHFYYRVSFEVSIVDKDFSAQIGHDDSKIVIKFKSKYRKELIWQNCLHYTELDS